MQLENLCTISWTLEIWVSFPVAAAGGFRTVSAPPFVTFMVVTPLGGLPLGVSSLGD